MNTTPRAPRNVSLAELLACGLIDESEVHVGGCVNESVRARAERQFRVAHPPSTPRRRPTRAVAPSRPRTVAPSRPRAVAPSRPRTVALSLTETHWTRMEACCVCVIKDRDHAIAPCFHMCVCSGCAHRITACPMCRGEIHDVHRIYY